jgi:hypothetical protein
MIRTVYVPALNRHVALADYIRAVKTALANPQATFSHGLTCWWSCTGEEIAEQFRRGMHDRINQAIPYVQRGMTVKAGDP